MSEHSVALDYTIDTVVVRMKLEVTGNDAIDSGAQDIIQGSSVVKHLERGQKVQASGTSYQEYFVSIRAPYEIDTYKKFMARLVSDLESYFHSQGRGGLSIGLTS